MRPAPTVLALVLTALAAGSAVAGPAGDPVRVEVKTGEGSDSMVFVARNGEGDSHALKIQSEPGKVLVEAEPDPDRPWLGVLLDDSGTSDDERTLKVLAVAKDSPASRAGLQVGDVIGSVDGQTLAQRGDDGLLGGRDPGDEIRLGLERDGKPMDLRVRLSGHPGRVEFAKAEGLDAFAFAGDTLQGLQGLEALQSLKGLKALKCLPGQKCPASGYCFSIGGRPRLGVSVEAMSEQLARFFGADAGRGVLVKDVVDGSAAKDAGIEAGDVILRIGKTDIRSVADVHAALEEVEKGDDVEVEVLRRGARKTMRATIDEPKRTGYFAPGRFAVPSQDEIERIAEEAVAAAVDATESMDALPPDYQEQVERARAAAEVAREQARGAREQAREALQEMRARREAERERQRAVERRREGDSGLVRPPSSDRFPTHGAFEPSPIDAPPGRGGRSTHVAE